MEGLYRHTDPEMQSMMRMYEFVEIEGLLLLEQFGDETANDAHGAPAPVGQVG
jgi:hypothetical protein